MLREPSMRRLKLRPMHSVGTPAFPAGAAVGDSFRGKLANAFWGSAIDSDACSGTRRRLSVASGGLCRARDANIHLKFRFLFCSGSLAVFTSFRSCLERIVTPSIEQLGYAVAKVIADQPEPVLVIASSDMNHYESDAITRVKDRRAIERILALDPRGLYDTVRGEGITMCGYAATVAMLVAVRELGATDAQLIRYATSGDINGDLSRVVGYAGIIVR